MKKNGFIATSLIYSFFLIFITLFLTIIADYLQNKVSLNTIENTIKEELNNNISIREFKVGDMVGFISNCDNINTELNNAPLYVIANVVNNNTLKCDGVNNCLILYSVRLGDYYTSNLTYDNIKEDIDFGYQNSTYYNKIIYNFDTSSSSNYNLGNNYIAYKNETDCINAEYISGNNCIKTTGSASYYRERYTLRNVSDEKYKKCASSDGTNTLYIEYTK